jgi:hypothetical protein
MDIRIAKHIDYETLKVWWSFWRFPAPPIQFLPRYEEDKFNGLIVSINGKDLAAGFLYETNSNMCWIEYIVTNPKTTAEERDEAIVKLLEELSISAKNLGYQIIFSSIKSESLISKYIKSGFIEGSKGTSELIKILQ